MPIHDQVVTSPPAARAIRVGMLVGAYAPDPEGGAERQCRLLARALTRRGCTVEALAVRHTARVPRVWDDQGVSVRRFGRLGPAASSLRGLLESRLLRAVGPDGPASAGPSDRRMRAAAFWLALPAVWTTRLGFLLEIHRFAAHRPAPFDILHVHESGWLAGVGVALAGRWRIPVVCKEASARALAPIGYDTPFRRKWDRLRRQADAWVAQTPTVAAEMRTLGIPDDRVHVVPNGVELPPGAADPMRADDVLYVGNLTQGAAWKAFDVLFDGWIRVVREKADARLTVAGGGDAEPWVRVLKRASAETTVAFAGRCDDLSPLYRRSGVFVLPSRVEGMSNALLEAQSWGLPCVVSDIPGNTAVVTHEVNGLVVPVGDAPALAQAILRLLGDASLRAKLGAAARRRAEGEFAQDRVVERLLDIYRKVLA